MKNFYSALIITIAVTALFAASPAEAAHRGKHAAQTVAADDTAGDLYTRRSTTGVLALENLHENGSTCQTCSNGIYGTSGTHNMHSNEY